MVDDNWPYRPNNKTKEEKIKNLLAEVEKKKIWRRRSVVFVCCRGPNATANLTNAVSLILRECPLGRCRRRRRPGSSSCHMLLSPLSHIHPSSKYTTNAHIAWYASITRSPCDEIIAPCFRSSIFVEFSLLHTQQFTHQFLYF